jgi:hypothetical protein
MYRRCAGVVTGDYQNERDDVDHAECDGRCSKHCIQHDENLLSLTGWLAQGGRSQGNNNNNNDNNNNNNDNTNNSNYLLLFLLLLHVSSSEITRDLLISRR